MSGQLAAIGRSQAVIEFSLDGRILTANNNFLQVLGYRLEEIQGKHHSMFVEEAYQASREYREFWERLGRGEFFADQYKRVGKGGREIWIQASYNPILDPSGKPYKVVKYASDITVQKMAADDLQYKVDKLLDVVAAAAKGDLTQQITAQGDDPAGKMAVGLERLLSDLRESVASIGQTASGVSSSSEELSSVSAQLRASSEEAAQQAKDAAAISDQVSSNVSIVAASAEEMLASLAERLSRVGRLPVVEAEAGMRVQPGRVLLAPGDFHMRVVKRSGGVETTLDQRERESFCRPSVDALFRSVGAAYGGAVIATVLTGMGSDGLEGVRGLKALGATVLVQDKATSVVWGMPGAIAAAQLADQVLPLGEIYSKIARQLR